MKSLTIKELKAILDKYDENEEVFIACAKIGYMPIGYGISMIEDVIKDTDIETDWIDDEYNYNRILNKTGRICLVGRTHY